MRGESQRAKQIRVLVKEWLKSGEDIVPDELKNILQHRIDSQRFQRFSRQIVERYKNGSLALHFHLFETSNDARLVEGHAHIPEYCAVSQFFVPQEGCEALQPPKLDAACNCGGDAQSFVFVDVMEFVEDEERIVPSIVRLQSLDECRSFWGDPIKSMAFDLFSEILRIRADRKRVPVDRLIGGISQYKLPDQMIEGRPAVEQTISDHEAEPARDFGKEHSENEHPKIRVLLWDDLAFAIRKRTENFKYRIEMFLSPDQFEPRAVERRFHQNEQYSRKDG